MKDLYLIFKNLTRNKLRLILNTFAIITAFFLFTALGSLNHAMNAGVDLLADDRLMVVNKINFTQPLPMSYISKVRGMEGVERASFANWFGGYYQDPQAFLTVFAVDPESYLELYPEYVLPEDQRQSWLQNRRGMVIGQVLAERYGWKVGDLIPLSSNIFSQSNGSNTWEMEVSGIFTGSSEQIFTNLILFHHQYFMESTDFGGGDNIGWIIVSTGDPARNQDIATAIDAQFANSPFETETTSEKQFNQAFLEQMGNISLIINSVVMAAFFTILLIVGNTMALAIRERTSEIAVLKTLGFSAPRMFRMVLLESIALSAVGGLLGLFLANLTISGISQVPDIQNMFPTLMVAPEVMVLALVYMLLLGLLTGFFPAWRALKLNTIDALSRG